jgi:hypothetical protein
MEPPHEPGTGGRGEELPQGSLRPPVVLLFPTTVSPAAARIVALIRHAAGDCVALVIWERAYSPTSSDMGKRSSRPPHSSSVGTGMSCLRVQRVAA